MMKQKLYAMFALLLLLGALVQLFSPSAFAKQQSFQVFACAPQKHYYGETAWLENSPTLGNTNYQRFQIPYQAFGISLHANNMAPGPADVSFIARISSEQWIVMDNGSWVEAGIINTYPDWIDNKQGPNPKVAYQFFWADGQAGNCQNVVYWVHTIHNTVPDGTTHQFVIAYEGDKTWKIYLDGSLVGVSTITGSSHAVAHRIGLEYGAQDSEACNRGGAFSDEFDISPYYWTGSQWNQWPPETDEFTPVGFSFHHQWNYYSPYQFQTWKDRC